MTNAKLNAAIAAIDQKYYSMLNAAKIELARLASEHKLEKQRPRLEQTRDTKDNFNHIKADCKYKHARDWYNEIKKAHMQCVKFTFKHRVFQCFNAHPHTVSSTQVFREFQTHNYTDFNAQFTEEILCAPYEGGFLTPSAEYFYFRTHRGDAYERAYARIEIKTSIFIATPFWSMQREEAIDALSYGYIHQHPSAQ